MKFWFVIALSIFSSERSAAKSADILIDYDRLDLIVTIISLRSGNQDLSGQNNYYFKLTASALLISKEEIKKPFEERLKVEREIGEFGQLQIKSLKIWQPDKKPNPTFSQALSGDSIREITAETMRQFNVAEDGIAIFCRVDMFERNKKFGILGEDFKVGEEIFAIVPESLPHEPQIENRKLVISDKLGTLVEIQVHFKALENKQVEKK